MFEKVRFQNKYHQASLGGKNEEKDCKPVIVINFSSFYDCMWKSQN